MGLSARDSRVAEAVLGREHPLARALAQRYALARQLVVALAAFGTALGAVVVHLPMGLLFAVAAGIVSVALALADAAARRRVREGSQGLLAAGEEALLLTPVVHERRRLLSRRERERLARSLERLLRDARRWDEILPQFRPLPGVQNLRHTSREAEVVVSILRAEGAEVRGVALVARLICDGFASPLYVGDAHTLREELRRIRYVLESRPPAREIEERRAA